jgi:ribonuclease-3
VPPRPAEDRTAALSIDDQLIDECERIIGHAFADRSLLVVALTHASIATTRVESNERLEFLGDAVLGMVVCDDLYHRFPTALEGEMTKIKSAVVSRRMCAKIASDLGLDRLLILGKGMKTRTAIPSSLSAAVLESVIGAIYLDAGLDRARAFLMPLIQPHIDAAAESGHQQNFKSVLQQHAQQQLSAQPVYVLLDENGPDHAKAFQVAVEVAGTRYKTCWANSKKQAEQLAALAALTQLGLIVEDESGEMVVREVPAAESGSGDSELPREEAA